MRRFWKVIRWVAGISIVIAIVFGGAALFIAPKIAEAIRKQQEANLGPEVEVAAAERGDLTRLVSAPGTVTCTTSSDSTPSASSSARQLSASFSVTDSLKRATTCAGWSGPRTRRSIGWLVCPSNG